MLLCAGDNAVSAPAAFAVADLRDERVGSQSPECWWGLRVTTAPKDRKPTRAAGNEKGCLACFVGLTREIHSHTQKKLYEQNPFLFWIL